jgi:ankyrin
LLNQTNTFGQTPLSSAVLSRRTNVVEFLDHKGAKWDAYSAVSIGRIDKIQEILADDPDAAKRSYSGTTLLNLAVNVGNVEVTKILLEHHADLDAQSSWGFSPLGIALTQNRVEIADLLRQHGATENIFDAVYCNDLPKVKNLFSADKSLVQASSKSGLNLVEIAARTDSVEMLKLLLDSGASPAVTNQQNGRTPLHMAAIFDSTNVAALLIRERVSINAIDARGFSPLHLAAMQGSSGVAALLLKNKADPDALVGETEMSMRPFPQPGFSGLAGCTALQLAAMYGETNIITLLLQHGADINVNNANGMNAARMAARQNGMPTPMLTQIDLTRVYGPLIGQEQQKTNWLQNLRDRQKAAGEMIKNQAQALERAP